MSNSLIRSSRSSRSSLRSSQLFIDRGTIVSVYETIPGIILQYTRLFAAVWFIRSVNTTMFQFPNQKRRFYRKYAIIFGMWFLWLVINSWISTR